MNSTWNKAANRPFLQAVLINLPALAVLSQHHVVWAWDSSWYAQGAFDAINILVTEPGRYFHYLVTLFGFKAPLISWISQVWVPLARALDRPETLMLTSWLSTVVSAWFLIRGTGTWIAGLILSSFNLVFHLNHEFFVEPLQMVSVCWFIFLALRRAELSFGTLLIESFLAGMVGLSAKVSSPLYVLIWVLPIVHALYLKRREGISRADFRAAYLPLFLLSGLTVVWYAINLQALREFVASVSAGEIAEHYGHSLPFRQKLDFWFGHFLAESVGGRTRDVSIAVFWIGAGYAAFQVWRKRAGIAVDRVAAGASLAQIALVLCVFSRQVNEEIRYLLPLFPSVAVLGWISLSHPRLRHAAILIAAAHLLELTLISANLVGSRFYSPWGSPIRDERPLAAKIDLVLERVCRDERPSGLIGVDRAELNSVTFNFRVSYRREYFERKCIFYTLGYAPKSIEASMAYWKPFDPRYYVTYSEQALQELSDPFNQIALPMYQALAASPEWVREPLPSDWILLRKK